MAKSLNRKQAKELVREYTELREQLKKLSLLPEIFRSDVERICDTIAAEQVAEILKDIPVEQINQKKKGIRVKVLRDHGIDTIQQLSTYTERQLSAFNGISMDAARMIHWELDNLMRQARKGVRIRLNSDDRNVRSGSLVLAAVQYRQSMKYASFSKELLNEFNNELDDCLADLQEVNSGLKWFFTSSEKKGRAQRAYDTLKQWSFTESARECQKILKHLPEIVDLSQREAWSIYVRDAIEINGLLQKMIPDLFSEDEGFKGLPEDLAHAIQQQEFNGEGLRCTLRSYQLWGVKYILHQGKVLLGDEMGLGKTVQAIAAMVSLRNTGSTHFVVVCPASVLSNWCREISKHSDLGVIKVHGPSKEKALQQWILDGGVAVTTFETTDDFVLDDPFRFSMLIVDEAHYIKNPQARRTKYTRQLAEHTDRLLFMTGTALENRIDEMIELISILQPDLVPVIKNMAALSNAEIFRERISPVYYRRRREDVLKELPELIEVEEWCEMNKEEEKVYEEAVMHGSTNSARRVSWHMDDLSLSSKASHLLELVEQARQEQRKVIVFSFFLDTLDKVQQLMQGQCMPLIHGGVSPENRQQIIDEFDQAPAGTVLPAQILAGGTGLNIQSASVVILCEPQLKPSIENQAIARAYRMGQTRNVLVYRLLCEDSIDEHILALLQEKQHVFDQFADQSAAADQSLQLDQKMMSELMEKEKERIQNKTKEEPLS